MTRCPHCKLPLTPTAGAGAALTCARCGGAHSALTPRQRDVLEAIAALGGVAPPSSQEIADGLGISRQAAKKHLDELERMGLVRDEPVMVRSGKWRVVGVPPPNIFAPDAETLADPLKVLTEPDPPALPLKDDWRCGVKGWDY